LKSCSRPRGEVNSWQIADSIAADVGINCSMLAVSLAQPPVEIGRCLPERFSVVLGGREETPREIEIDATSFLSSGITNAIQSITESSNLNFVEELPE